MLKLNAIIVDDEAESIEALKIKLGHCCPEVNIVATVMDPRYVIQMIDSNPIDILFLDVEMPGINGFALLEALKSHYFEVIMVTAFNEYALQALKANAIDYLLKPVDTGELRTAVDKVLLKKSRQSDVEQIARKIETLSALVEGGESKSRKIKLYSLKDIQFVHTDQIIRLEGSGNYCTFHLANAPRVVVSKTLKEYEEALAMPNFFRVHKSHLINLDYLTRIIKGPEITVVMTDGSEIEVSARRKAEFLKYLEA